MLKTLHSRHNEVFLALLKDRRLAKRLRQSDLARVLGRGQGTVSKVERGERRLDVIELRLWLNALGDDFVMFARDLDGLLDQASLHLTMRLNHRLVMPRRINPEPQDR